MCIVQTAALKASTALLNMELTTLGKRYGIKMNGAEAGTASKIEHPYPFPETSSTLVFGKALRSCLLPVHYRMSKPSKYPTNMMAAPDSFS